MVRVPCCRVELAFVAFLVVLFAGGCSSGLEGSGASASAVSTAITSSNLRFGFDPGLTPSAPFGETDVAGGVLPGLNGEPDRPVVFLAFATDARADDGDGNGNALDRSTTPPTDAAGTSDIFVAAVAADMIDERAFVYSLAGKFRHPRCVTCHSMNVTAASGTAGGDTTAFTTGTAHPGPVLPVGIAANCAECHGAVEDWRSPPAGLDLRNLSAQELFVRSQQAINGPDGPTEHFETDSRVLWALGSNGGALPFGNVADDDHDGVLEPEDSDGVARLVPGGVGDFLERFRAWKDSGQLFDSAAALQDLVLASRASVGNSAGNNDSFSPSAHYRPNPVFDPMVSNPDLVPAGFLRVAYASDATNMVGGTGNAATDVFLIDVQVFQRSSGAIDLVTDIGSQTLVSRAIAGQANGISNSPEIGGSNGERVAFRSTATNLIAGFQNNNGADPDIFAAEPGINSMVLVSHAAGASASGGNGASSSPRLDPTGTIVAFDSIATDLVAGDTNGARDVFYADAFQFGFDPVRASVASGGTEASGGDSFDPSVYAFPGTTDVRIAYTSAKTDLVTDTLPGTNNVYVFDSRTGGGTTTLLNRINGPAGTATPAMDSPSQEASNPEIAANGMSVLFESMSADIDFVRPNDDNGVMDVMFADLALLETDGFVLPYTLSVGPDGGGANGASSAPVIASLNPTTDEFPLGVAAFRTSATNLANPDPTGDVDMDGIPDFENIVLMFVKEGATVVADFEATPGKQGAGRVVTFESTSSGDPTSFFWDFGDGTTSTAPRPAHVYQNPGLYTVMMRAEGELGTDTRERVDYVRVVGPADALFSTTKDASLSGVSQAGANNIPSNQTIRGAVDPNMASSLRFEFDSTGSTECPDQFDWRLTELDTLSGLPIAAAVTVGTSEDAMSEVILDRRAHYDWNSSRRARVVRERARRSASKFGTARRQPSRPPPR